MAPTTESESSARVEMTHQRHLSSTGDAERRAANNHTDLSLTVVTDAPEKAMPDHDQDDDDDRDDKSWRTRGESSPSLASAMASPPRSLGNSLSLPPRRWDDAVGESATGGERPERRKRQVFWRNIVRQYNFVDQEDERALLLSLTDGIDWTTMDLLPRAFVARHKEVYYLICRGDYERSSMIQRDVTRTFSIFERSQLPKRARDVDAQQRALFRVLNAVAEAEDGYCQGMNFIAALFLVEGLDEADAYALFLYLLRKRQLARIYHHSSTFLDDYLVHFERMLQRELPDLHAHMHAQGFVIPMYGIEWFTTLFSLSTKPDLACAIFDLFFVGVQDIFLRMGLAVLKLLEAPLMCMSFEDFLRDFKPLVRQIDPYHAVLCALAFRPNPHVARGEDTTTHIARIHYTRAASATAAPSGDVGVRTPPRAFLRHRSLPPEMAAAIAAGDGALVSSLWLLMTAQRESALHWLVLANEILHFAVWHGQVDVAWFVVRQCGADVDNADDTALTPLHFAVLRDQPDLVRLLLCCGADPNARGGRWSGGADQGLTPLETALHWKFRDTTAARLVLEREVCLCCNTKFDAFAFHRETCRTCKFPFCGRGAESCLARHQCPDVYRRWRQRLRRRDEATRPRDGYDEDDVGTAVGEDTVELAAESISAAASDSTGSAPSSVSSRRSSRCTSEASSSLSFVLINSPARDLPTDRVHGLKADSMGTQGGIHSTSTTGDDAQPRVGLLGSLVGWLSGVTTEPREDDTDDELMRANLGRGIDFPDGPEWYCNELECHSVFSFFYRGDECTRCSGFFCANDFDSRSRQCRRCSRS